MENSNDQIEELINEAHTIFDKTLAFEVVDLTDELIREFLNNAYGNPETELVERYLNVIRKLRRVTG